MALPIHLNLASTSRYRAELLCRLGLPFGQYAPEIDETPLVREAPRALAERLAHEKAMAVARQRPGVWALGSDQAAAVGAERLEKPGTLTRAKAQLSAMSGQRVAFFTAYSLCRDGQCLSGIDVTMVQLRALSPDDIERYLAREPALDCAGSFKCEGLGISLFDVIETRDPTALIGLPLIGVAALLRSVGFSVP